MGKTAWIRNIACVVGGSYMVVSSRITTDDGDVIVGGVREKGLDEMGTYEASDISLA